MMAHPIHRPNWAVMTMARGDAMLALLDSSERWNGASYPDMVQIVVKKPMIVAHPIGHSVPFSKVIQTSWLLLVLGWFMEPTGNHITKMITTRIFHTVPTLLTQPMNQVD